MYCCDQGTKGSVHGIGAVQYHAHNSIVPSMTWIDCSGRGRNTHLPGLRCIPVLTTFNYLVHHHTVVIQEVRMQRISQAPQLSTTGIGTPDCQHGLHSKRGAHPSYASTPKKNQQLLCIACFYAHDRIEKVCNSNGVSWDSAFAEKFLTALM